MVTSSAVTRTYAGSRPARPLKIGGWCSLVASSPWKREAAGSNPAPPTNLSCGTNKKGVVMRFIYENILSWIRREVESVSHDPFEQLEWLRLVQEAVEEAIDELE